MADTTFTDGSTTIVAAWLNDVNDFVYTNGVDKTSVQTLTNKTLTSPTITTPTISSPTITGTTSAAAITATTVTATGAITSSGGGIGYTTGNGGTVTQITNKNTTVVLNELCGDITLAAGALSAAAEAIFSVTNSTVAATDNVFVSHASGGSAGSYMVGVCAIGSGSFSIVVTNVSSGSLNEQPVLRFTVLKGATS